MTRVIVTYPTTAGAKFDLDYYMSKHMPMVSQKLTPHGLTRWSVSKGVSGGAPGLPAPVSITATLEFSSIDQVLAGMGAEGAAIMGDVKNYTDIPPQVQIDEVLQ
jgi:uncharacterized protein (TIGR02118 family)